MTRRRWIAEKWDEATATLAGAQAEHMVRVLRAQPGEEADVVAGGRVFHSVVASIADGGPGGRPEVRFNLIAEVEAEPGNAHYAGNVHFQVRSHGVGNRKSDGIGSRGDRAGDRATH